MQNKTPLSKQLVERTTCSISNEPLVDLFSFGPLHVSQFPRADENPVSEPVELKLRLAKKSGLIQLACNVPPDFMYTTYWYNSGTNASMTNELRQIAESAQSLVQMRKGDVFIDIGCNDGTLFRFVDPGVVRVGFDPAKNIVPKAKEFSSLVISDYFNAGAYQRSEHGKTRAKIITSIAMFYDVDDPHSFIEDIKAVLDTNGLWIIQMGSYPPVMLRQLAFDNIYHEHLKYYTLSSLKYLLDMHDMEIVDCHLNDVNGGSFRAYVRKREADPTTFATAPYRDMADFRVQSLLCYEESLDLKNPKTYENFFEECSALKKQTVDFITAERAKGKRVWGYGASTKGNTLLQWFGLDNKLVQGIAERSPAKFGRKTIGTNIPIYSEDEMRKQNPDYLLLLPWHFISEFKKREAEFLKRGGKFIVPCPKFEILGL
jgi:hypothetical protein